MRPRIGADRRAGIRRRGPRRRRGRPRRPFADADHPRNDAQRCARRIRPRSAYRRTVQRNAAHGGTYGRRFRDAERNGADVERIGRRIPDRNPRRRSGLGEKRRTADVQRPRRRFPGGPDSGDDPRRLDGRFAREVLPDPPRRIPAAQQPDGPAPRPAAPDGGRLPPVPACGDARRNDLRRSGVPHRKQIHGVGAVPVALHERRIRLARHRGPCRPHGLFRPAAVVRNGEGRLFGPRGRQPEHRAQLRGEHRRDGHAPDPRRRRGTGSRPEQQRRLFRFRPGQYRIHAHDRGERGIRVLPEVHHRPRNPEPPAAQRVRFGLPRHGRRHAFLAGQPLRRPPRRDRAEPQLHGDRLRPRRRKAIPSELYEERNGGHALERIRRPHGAGRHAGGGERGESRAAGPQRHPLGAVRRGLGAVRRVYRRAGRDHRRTAGAHRRRAALALVAEVLQPDLLPRGRGGHVAHPAQGMFAPAAFLVGTRIRVSDHVRRRGPAPDPAVGAARSAAAPLQPALPHRTGDKNRSDRTGGRFFRRKPRGRLAGENRLLAARGAGGHRPRSPRTPHMALSDGRRSRGPFRRRG